MLESCIMPFLSLQMSERKGTKHRITVYNENRHKQFKTEMNTGIQIIKKTLSNKYNVTNAFSCLWDLQWCTNLYMS